MSAFAETGAILFGGGPRVLVGRVLRLAAVVAILAVALPAALGSGIWGGGVDPTRLLSPVDSPSADQGSSFRPSLPTKGGHGSDSRQTRREAGTQS